MITQPKIYVAGHRGMVGSAILRNLKLLGHENLVTRTHAELDLTKQEEVREFFEAEKVDQIYLCAARVGGIHANNSFPAMFIYENLMIEANVIHNAWQTGVSKLLFLGSSCIYPKLSEQPMKENVLLSGPLESTNEPYAISKIAGIKLCESYNRQYQTNFRSVMPTNLYGPGDNYHSENSHVIPGLIRRFHEAKVNGAQEVVIWGSGDPYREFLYVDDMASASIHVMNMEPSDYKKQTEPMLSHLNVGFGTDIKISNLAVEVARIVKYDGDIVFDTEKPDGAPRKLLDSSRLNALGWHPKVTLEDGLSKTYTDFLQNYKQLRL
jgi:GDP-L-fucose synthase